MTCKKEVAIQYSRYVHHTSFYKKTTEREWINHINSELKRHSIDVILPVFEHSIRTLSLYRNLLISPEKLGLLPNIEDFDIAVHKWSLAKHLVKHNIPHPKCIQVVSGEKPETEGLESMSFPLILKPIVGSGGGVGIRIFEERKALISYLKSIENGKEFVLQHVIGGTDFCSNVICENGEILAYTVQKHTLHGNREFAPQLGLQYIDNPVIHETTRKLMKSLNWSGVANLDIRYDAETDVYFIIEVNPRFWGSVEGSMLAGVNFPHLYIKIVLGDDIVTTVCKKQGFFNLKGVLLQVKRRPSYIFKWKWLWNETQFRFVMKDPRFYLIRVLRKFFNT